MKLKTKILLPLLIAPLVAGFVGLLVMSSQLDSLRQHTHQETITAKYGEITAMMDYAARSALEQAAVFSHLPVVLRALEIAHEGNIDDERDAKGQEARELLRKGLLEALQGYETQLAGQKLKLHFHLPNGHSLARLWREQQSNRDGKWEDISDDVSSFRSTVLEVNRTGRPVKGIELGRGGFVIRGLAPVKTLDGAGLGSVEVLVDFNHMLDRVINDHGGLLERQSLFLFMDAKHLDITTRLRDANQYPPLGEFIQVHASGEAFGRDWLDPDLLKQGREGIVVDHRNHVMLGVFPVRDYKDQVIGVIAYTLDITTDERFVNWLKMSLIATLFVVLLVMGVLVYAMGWFFILAPIQEILDFIAHVREGSRDRELKLDNTDELGELAESVNQLVQGQRHVLNQIHHAGVQVTSSATELAATAKEHRATILQQVDSTETVSDSVEQITTVISDLKSTVDRVAALSVETAEFASRGQDDLSHMKDAMHQMEPASRSISSRLEAINDKTENITTVVTTITKVAEQTNLLSLNAAIEAEKAGEYGHGFNVVAREIRRLADQTAVATLDIENMVKDMQSAVAAGVMEMDKFVGVVRHSAEDVSKISGQLSRIIEQVQMLSPGFEDVKVAMTQQTEHAQQIRSEMSALAEGMRQTSDTLQESFQAIEQLNQAARGLQNEVERFKQKPIDDSLRASLPRLHG